MRPARSSTAVFWRAAALGFWVMALFNAVLLAYAWGRFAVLGPDYFAEAWPTFSRALSSGDVQTYGWLAAIAGAGLFLGAASVAAMRWGLAQQSRECRGWLMAAVACAAVASLLGVVHYFHVTIRLGVNSDLHMLLSYVFFFGMTAVIAVDGWCCGHVPALRAGGGSPSLQRLARMRHAVGGLVLAAGALFLLGYILKDVQWNPWADATQKVFVCMETAWIVFVHGYALLYVAPVRAHFQPAPCRVGEAIQSAAARSACLLALAGSAFWLFPDANAASPPAALGGSGRIQPAGGVLAIAGPGGHTVERVEVREGDRVRKGTVLLVLADRAAKAIERDLAEERLRKVERQAIDLPRAAALDAEAARIALAQARADADALKGLDERTVSERERRQRLGAITQAEAALQVAVARIDAAGWSSAAELRMAQRALKLADSTLAATRVVAPMDATVLEVHVQAGSTLSGGGAILLADTSRMYVVADVFEGDLPRFKAGQPAKVSNAALGQALAGTVERIGRVVDPVNRLAKVWIRLERASPADRFIGMQVDVRVDGAQPGGLKPARP